MGIMGYGTDTGERCAAVQGTWGAGGRVSRPAGTISWAEHLEAYLAHSKRYGTSQSAERIHERGGFGYGELVVFLGREPITWRAR